MSHFVKCIHYNYGRISTKVFTAMLRRSVCHSCGNLTARRQALSTSRGKMSSPGFRQSPVDISSAGAVKEPKLQSLSLLNWSNPVHGTLENNGYSLHFHPTEKKAGLVTHLGAYTIQQFHFHWGSIDTEGSEHNLNGNKYAAEIHFVATKDKGPDKTAPDYCSVLGVFCEADSSVSSTDEPWNALSLDPVIESGSRFDTQDVVLQDFLPKSLDYFHYGGSLTTPNYDEIVQWYVFRDPVKMPSSFLKDLRRLKDPNAKDITANFRGLQCLNGRVISTHP